MSKSTKILKTNISHTSLYKVAELLINEQSKKIAICNANTLVRSYQNPNINAIIENFDLRTPDGYPVAKALSFFNKQKFYRVDGYKVFLKTIELGLEKNTTHFFFGNSEEVNQLMIKNLKDLYPGIKIKGFISPKYLNSKELFLIYKNEILLMESDIVWVSLGFPKQEEFINLLTEDSKYISNFVGVGAVFEWVAGTKFKAPEWVADRGLEWLFRLLQEPKRLFKRYLIDNSLFIFFLLKQIFKNALDNNK